MSDYWFPGDSTNCRRCSRWVILVAPEQIPDGPLDIPRWLPANTTDRFDCPARSGDHCTPYQPE